MFRFFIKYFILLELFLTIFWNYKLHSQTNDDFQNLGKIKFPQSSSVKSNYVYDSKNNVYIYSKTIDNYPINTPLVLKPDEFEYLIIKENIKKNFDHWWWKYWSKEKMPNIEYVIQSWDTAYTASSTSDYSACTTWGVFNGQGGFNVFLLDSFRERLTFPELKNAAIRLYNDMQPDQVLVEAKASGLSLVQELMRTGIPITPFNPKRMDKLARVHSVAPLFESGRIWCPDTDESEAVVSQAAAFPNTKNDDLVDSMTQALIRLRKGFMVSHPQDMPFEEPTGPKGSYW